MSNSSGFPDHAIGGGGSTSVENSETTGVIIEVMTDPAPAGTTGVTVQASDDEPRFVIKNDNTRKETAYKAQNIIGHYNE
ncbi:hypothetical protein FRC20_003155 [Serendipita sp. 405]|nr:hypothetical protein FRC15_010142 [Serendipita sp. 397]KAG8845570.1 hypothetical protein FRC20_003155 [Serendipita sp. 405]